LSGYLEEQGLSLEDGELTISRKIMASGKNVFRLNGETVSASVVKELAAGLIDIHGQHEHQSLLKKAKHLQMLDRFAGEALADRKERMAELYRGWRALKEELGTAQVDEEKRLRELSFLQYELNEIEEAKLVPGEEEELRAEHKRLSNRNLICESLDKVYQLTGEGSECAAEQVGYAMRSLGRVEEYGEELAGLYRTLGQIEDLIHDFNRELTDYIESSGGEEERFAQVEERLDLVNRLTSRYGATVEAVLRHAEECRVLIEKYENYDEYVAGLERRCREAEKELSELSEQVSAIRREKAAELTALLTEALRDLNFLDVRLELHFERLESFTALGTDDVEFLISTNPGEPLHPLAKIASGGELSRIMLALKSVFSGKDEIDSMIFDEIDVGVSGRTAQLVSEKMARIAAERQLLCITHLPQIAAMADTHFIIEKTTDGLTTRTDIRRLSREGEIGEIARMLGGVEITDKVLESAAEMKSMADKKKKELVRPKSKD
ncbi:MAG: DNA repair protein RecN, partial [Lachnospiraceae bacterium]|nr:DNA repair protein RecN [Lachnospiraceae bacterium]